MPTPLAPPKPAEGKQHRQLPLPGLTTLRFIAATYVLLFHFLPRHPADPAHPALPYRWLDAGFTGVSAFFVLSGFILAYTHPHVPDVRRFYRARFARVYPLYLFAFLWALEPFLWDVRHFHRRSALWAIPADLFLVQDWFPHLALLVNTPAWTLSCEGFFYLVFPFCVAWLAPLRHRPLLPILCLWAGELIPAILTNTWMPVHHPDWTTFAHGLLLSPLARLGEFFAGILLGLHFLDHARSHPARWPEAPAWLLPLSCLLCLACVSLNGAIPHEVLRNGLLTGPLCLLIWALACSRSRLLSSAPLQLAGEISFGVYLLQMPFSHTLALAIQHFHVLFQRSPVWILSIFPVAWLTYTFIEKPCRSLLLGHRPSSREKPIPTLQTNLP